MVEFSYVVNLPKYARWLCIVGCLLSGAASSEELSARDADALSKVWSSVQQAELQNESVVRERLARFQIENPKVSDFIARRMKGCMFRSHDMAGREARLDRRRICAVLELNGPLSCLWMICNARRMNTTGLVVPLYAKFAQPYREWYQQLANALLDTRIPATGSAGGALAPFRVYEDRICDYAYHQLRANLGANAALARAAKRMGISWPSVRFGPKMAYPERDKRLHGVWNLLSSKDGKSVVMSFPSAAAKMEPSEQTSGIFAQAGRILGQGVFGIGSSEKAERPRLIDVLDGEIPALTAQERAVRKKLLGKEYSAADIVVRLPQEIERRRGVIEWVLLNRKDRTDIAVALLELPKQNDIVAVKRAVLKLGGELVVTWGTDEPASQTLIEMLKRCAADENEHWTVRIQASESLGRCKVTAKGSTSIGAQRRQG